MLTFESITLHKPGVFASLLTESYGELLSSGGQFWQDEKASWIRLDEDVFDNPATIGQCVFVTRWIASVVGFSSFDPTNGPSFGIIGHNCILPNYRGHGFGTDQIRETLRRLEIRSMRAGCRFNMRTSFLHSGATDIPFAWFQGVEEVSWSPRTRYQIIEYELDLCRNTLSR